MRSTFFKLRLSYVDMARGVSALGFYFFLSCKILKNLFSSSIYFQIIKQLESTKGYLGCNCTGLAVGQTEVALICQFLCHEQTTKYTKITLHFIIDLFPQSMKKDNCHCENLDGIVTTLCRAITGCSGSI